jgi:hypothetical protein
MEEVAHLTAQLVRDLNDTYASAPAADALDYVERIESRIANELKVAIRGLLKSLDHRVINLHDQKFLMEGFIFEVMVGYRDLLKKHDTAAIVVMEETQPPKPIRSSLPIEGFGKYKNLEVFISPRLSAHMPAISELSQKFYEGGYSWLREFIDIKAEQFEAAMVVELYRALRLAFAGKTILVDLIWLVLVDKHKGMYLFDQHATIRTIKTIGIHRGTTRESASALFLGLLTSAIPFEKMFSRHTIPTGDCLHVDFAATEYTDKTMFALAERVLFKSTTRKTQVASVFPIARNEEPYLIAAFPTAEENEILPILRAHMLELQTVFNTQKSRARVLIDKLRPTSAGKLPYGPLGEFMGGVIKAFTG